MTSLLLKHVTYIALIMGKFRYCTICMGWTTMWRTICWRDYPTQEDGEAENNFNFKINEYLCFEITFCWVVSPFRASNLAYLIANTVTEIPFASKINYLLVLELKSIDINIRWKLIWCRSMAKRPCSLSAQAQLNCIHMRSHALTCNHLQSLVIMCIHLCSLAITRIHLHSIALPCTHFHSSVFICNLLQSLAFIIICVPLL
jgi:hypothetical protein